MSLMYCFRVCEINSVDGSNITCYNVHEFDAIGRAGSRASRVLISGHSNGGIQVVAVLTF